MQPSHMMESPLLSESTFQHWSPAWILKEFERYIGTLNMPFNASRALKASSRDGKVWWWPANYMRSSPPNHSPYPPIQEQQQFISATNCQGSQSTTPRWWGWNRHQLIASSTNARPTSSQWKTSNKRVLRPSTHWLTMPLRYQTTQPFEDGTRGWEWSIFLINSAWPTGSPPHWPWKQMITSSKAQRWLLIPPKFFSAALRNALRQRCWGKNLHQQAADHEHNLPPPHHRIVHLCIWGLGPTFRGRKNIDRTLPDNPRGLST